MKGSLNPITHRLPFVVHLGFEEHLYADILSVLSSSCESLERELGASHLQVRVRWFDDETEEDVTTYHGHAAGFFTEKEWSRCKEAEDV